MPRESLLQVASELKHHPQYRFDLLTNLTAVDEEEHFTVVYHLVSVEKNVMLTLKVHVTDKKSPKLPSVFSVWPAADWQEREVYDLFGIIFQGHPNMKRILLSDDFVGHPLRKDYQLEKNR